MTGILQLRRSNTAGIIAATPSAGEELINTDWWKPVIGDGATAGGILVDGNVKNAQTGTSYTVLASDVSKLITFSNAAAIAVTLPQAGSSSGTFFPNQARFWVINLGAGIATITPTTSTINGKTSLYLGPGDGAMISSDGTNYFAVVGRAGQFTTEIHTTNYTVALADNGKHFNNIGASGTVDFQLPAAASSLTYSLLCYAAQKVRFLAATGEQIAWGSTNSATSGNIGSNTPFSFVTIEAHGASQWIVSSAEGSWTIDMP